MRFVERKAGNVVVLKLNETSGFVQERYVFLDCRPERWWWWWLSDLAA